MAVKLEVPSSGESVTEGTLSRWLKPNGATVQANEVMCELETDKATMEVRASVAGTLTIIVPEGQKVQVGATIGQIEEGAPSREKTRPNTPTAPAPAPARTEPALSPAARQLAAGKGIRSE